MGKTALVCCCFLICSSDHNSGNVTMCQRGQSSFGTGHELIFHLVFSGESSAGKTHAPVPHPKQPPTTAATNRSTPRPAGQRFFNKREIHCFSGKLQLQPLVPSPQPNSPHINNMRYFSTLLPSVGGCLAHTQNSQQACNLCSNIRIDVEFILIPWGIVFLIFWAECFISLYPIVDILVGPVHPIGHHHLSMDGGHGPRNPDGI